MDTQTIGIGGFIAFLASVLGKFDRGIAAAKRAMRFPLKERVEFYDNMVSLTRVGVPSSSALSEIHAVNARLGRRYTKLYADLLLGFRSGRDFGQVVSEHFPPIEALVLSSGQRAGSNDGYAAAAKIGRGLQRIRQAMVASLTYPTILCVVLVFILTGFAETILPQVERLKDKLVLSADMRVYMHFLEFVRDHKVGAGLAILALVLVVYFSLSRWTGRLRAWADRYLPPYILYRLYTGAVLLLSLGAMLRAKVPMEESLALVMRTSTPYLRSHIARVLSAVMRGKDEIEAWHTGLFQPSIMVRINALGKAGSIGNAIATLGDDGLDYCIRVMGGIAAGASAVVIIGIAVIVAYAVTFLNTVGVAAAAG